MAGIRKERTVYIVGHNMAGYLPDSDNYIVGTKRAAIGASRGDALRDLEGYNDGLSYMAETNPDWREYRYSFSGRGGDYWLTAARGADYHYWITESAAELGQVPAARDSWDRQRCGNCEMTLDPGDDAYYVSLADCYICLECL